MKRGLHLQRMGILLVPSRNQDECPSGAYIERERERGRERILKSNWRRGRLTFTEDGDSSGS